MITDAAGALVSAHDYYPFGMEITPTTNLDVTGGSRMRFTGHERDLHANTNLDYMKARYYGANFGRFLSVDPISGTPEIIQSWNRYVYVLNNPARLIDPNGKTYVDPAGQELYAYTMKHGNGWQKRQVSILQHTNIDVTTAISEDAAVAVLNADGYIIMDTSRRPNRLESLVGYTQA